MENQHLPRTVTKSLQTNLHNPYKYWPQEITEKIRGEFIILLKALLNTRRSACVSWGYPRVTYGCVSYPWVGYGSVGKGSLTFSALPYYSYHVRMTEMSDMYLMGRYVTVYTLMPFLSFLCAMSYLPYLSVLSVLSVCWLFVRLFVRTCVLL